MKLPKISHNASLVLITIGILAIAFVIYFFIIGQSRENQFNDRAFYVLNQVVENFNTQYEVFNNNVNELNDNIFGSDDTARLNKIYKYKCLIDGLCTDKNAIPDKAHKNKMYNDSLEQQVKLIINNYANRINPLIEFEGHELDQNQQDLKSNLNYFYFNTFFQNDSLDFKLIFKCNQASFIENIERKDIFNTFIIISDSSILYQDKSFDFKFNEFKTIKEQKDLVQKKINEKVDNRNFELFTIDPHTLTLNHAGKEYLGFATNSYMNFEGSWKNIEFIGIVEKSAFNQITRSVEPWIAIIVSLAVILIILGLPIIKLVIADIYEQIYISNVVGMAISLFLGISFISFTLFTVYTNYTDRNISIDKQLSYFSESIQQNLKNELKQIFRQVNQYKKNVRIQ